MTAAEPTERLPKFEAGCGVLAEEIQPELWILVCGRPVVVCSVLTHCTLRRKHNVRTLTNMFIFCFVGQLNNKLRRNRSENIGLREIH
jgi:hypothetical protein